MRSVRVLDYTVFPCPEGNVFFVPVQDVLRQDWSFTVPVGGIDNIGRNRQTRGVTAQLFHDFYAIINTCDKMTVPLPVWREKYSKDEPGFSAVRGLIFS